MKKSRKIIGLLVFMFCILFAGKVEAFAAVNNVDGMNIELKTNQSEYTGREEIEVTATVKNANDFTVEDLKLEAEVPDGYHMEDVSQQFEEVEGRESVQIEYLLIPDKGFFNFSNQKIMIALFLVILILLLICILILFVILKKRGKETLALFLCIVTVAGVLSPVGSMRVSATENKIKSGEYTAKKEILVDGEKITFSVKATYKMSKDLEDDTEYTEGEWVTILADKMQKNIEEDAFLNEYADSEEIATREFAAYTAIKVLGFEEETDLSCKDEEALEYSKADYLAVKQGLMFLEDNYFYPERALSTKEKNQIVAAINYFNDAFLIDPEDKTENVEYDEGVFVDEFKDVTDYTLEVNDKGKIIVKFDKNYLPKKFEEGSIFVLPKNNENIFGITLKAEKIKKDGDEVSLTCSYPKMEEVYSKLQFAGDCMLDENNITTAEGVGSKYLPVMYADVNQNDLPKAGESVEFSISKKIEIDDLEGELTGTLKLKAPEIFVKMDIDSPKDIFDVNEFALSIKENAEMNLSFGTEEKLDEPEIEEKFSKVELGELPFGLGATGLVIKVKVYAVASVSGEISIGFEVEKMFGMQYVNGSMRWLHDCSFEPLGLKIESSTKSGLELGVALGWVPLEKLHDFIDELPEEIIELSADIGLALDGSITIHKNVVCTDVAEYIYFEAGVDPSSLIGNILNGFEIELKLVFFDSENSPLSATLHLENGEVVDKCRFEDEEQDPFKELNDKLNQKPVELKNGSKISFLLFEPGWPCMGLPEENKWSDCEIKSESSFYEKDAIESLDGNVDTSWLLKKDTFSDTRYHDGMEDVQGLTVSYYEISDVKKADDILCSLNVSPFTRWGTPFVKVYVDEKYITTLEFPNEIQLMNKYTWNIAKIENETLTFLNQSHKFSDYLECEDLPYEYETQWATANSMTFLNCTFNYSDDWEIKQENVTQEKEEVMLCNGNLNICYNFNMINSFKMKTDTSQEFAYQFINKYSVSKVADSPFEMSYIQGTDYSYLGKFMVAKIENLDNEKHFVSEFYAIVPESYEGIHDNSQYNDALTQIFGTFYGYSESGQYTDEERNKIIQVLSTFR